MPTNGILYSLSLSFPVPNFLLRRTILHGIERYIRNVAEDLRDVYDVIKNNETKLDGLDKE